MNPIAMAAVIVTLLCLFAWSAHRRWNLMMVGGPTKESRFDRIGTRLAGVGSYALLQKKMRYYPVAGIAHNLIFAGFLVLLLRSIMLWSRGFDSASNLVVLGPDPVAGIPLGSIYALLKDVFAVLVIAGASVFVYYRTINVQKRMKLGFEGLLILVIIIVMMVSDIIYDGAATVLHHRFDVLCGGNASSDGWCRAASVVTAFKRGAASTTAVTWHAYPEPAGSAAAVALQGLGVGPLVVIAHAGFWTHSTLVLIFLNILPYSKHFHIITVLPNVMLRDITSPGRLRPLAKSGDDLMEMVEKATDQEDMNAAPIGHARIEHFTWKDILDFYTCTECGRCSDNCPAHMTGKVLSPKHLTVDLRDHLYLRQDEFMEAEGAPRGGVDIPWMGDGDGGGQVEPKEPASTVEASQEGADAEDAGPTVAAYEPIDLVPNVVHPDVLWACTTCRACEEQCPVMITYVDKIVSMRRHLVQIRGEFPPELNKPFEGMETNGNPWNLSRMDRAAWAEGLHVPTLAENPTAEVLFWVGCSASYDDRAKRIARATARLLQSAGVDFGILGEEESCTGDPARRAGNEFLAMMLAEANIETLNGYRDKGGVRKIVTTCPHCFNTLRNEYPDFGGRYEVIHHADYLSKLVANGKLKPKKKMDGPVVFHDSCYLGRYNGLYDAPRKLLSAVPGASIVEVDHYVKNKGLCCGAGGAQMFMEEQNKNRVNVKRTKQLLDTGARTIASACPYCMTMLTDGLKAESKEEEIGQLDVAEILAAACGLDDPSPAPAGPDSPEEEAVPA